MTLSVIVPVKRDPRLGRCLDALARQSLERDRFEILVVDNGPDAFIRRLAKKFSVRYLTHVNGGSYAARAQGAQEAKGGVLVFTDADCVPPSDWLSTVDALFADPICQVVTGPSSSTDHSPVSSWVQSIDETRWQALRRMKRVAFCDTRNLAVRREVLDVVPFDPTLRQAGDIDLGLRLYRAGIHIRMEPTLRLLHDHPRSLAAVLRRAVRRGRGLAQLQRKHGSFFGPIGERPLIVVGRDLKASILRWGRQPLVRWFAVPLVVASLVPLFAVLSVLARVPFGRAAGEPVFVIFERLSLLLGRLLG